MKVDGGRACLTAPWVRLLIFLSYYPKHLRGGAVIVFDAYLVDGLAVNK